MPLFERKCVVCPNITETLEPSAHTEETECSKCGSKKSCVRIISNTSFVLVGPGWAKDSYTGKH